MKKAIAVWLLGASSALAHPGHDAPVADGAAHWLLQLDHFIVIAAGIALVWLVLGSGALRRLHAYITRE